jgi:hypothetical protein
MYSTLFAHCHPRSCGGKEQKLSRKTKEENQIKISASRDFIE